MYSPKEIGRDKLVPIGKLVCDGNPRCGDVNRQRVLRKIRSKNNTKGVTDFLTDDICK